MNTKHVMIVLTTAVTLLSSCTENKQSHRLNYLAVQMEKNADWSIIDKDGNEVVKEEYPADVEISQVSDDGSFWVRSGGKYQLFSVEQPKKPLIDEEFTQATDFVDGRAVVGTPNTPIRIIDTKGKVVATLGTNIKRCFCYYDGYAVILNVDDLLGVIDREGRTVVTPIYQEMKGVSKGLAIVKKKKDDTTWNLINMKGQKTGEINTGKYKPFRISNGIVVAEGTDNPAGPTIIIDETGKKLFDIKKAPADKNSTSYYKEDFMVFTDADGKKGVVDDKGEIQIRGRYEDMFNIGQGNFAAKKGDNWGVVNAKDETLVDFDFSYYYWDMLGDNFLMRDGNTWSLMNKENKEITSFDNIGGNGHDYWADYVSIGHLVEQTAKMLEKFEQPKTGLDLSKELKLNIDEYHNSNSIIFDDSFNDKISISLKMLFFNNLAEEKTHTVKESDGWFTYDKTISDGWVWRTEPFSIIEGIIKINKEIDFTSFVTALDKRLKQTHQEISEGEYSRAVNANGKKMSYGLKLEHTAGGLDVTIQELDK